MRTVSSLEKNLFNIQLSYCDAVKLQPSFPAFLKANGILLGISKVKMLDLASLTLPGQTGDVAFRVGELSPGIQGRKSSEKNISKLCGTIYSAFYLLQKYS